MSSEIFDLDDQAEGATGSLELDPATVPDPYIPEITPTGLGRSDPLAAPVIRFDLAARILSSMDTLQAKDVPIVSLTISDLAGAELRKAEVRATDFGNVNGRIDKTLWRDMDTAGLPPGLYRITLFAQWSFFAIFSAYIVAGGGVQARVGDQVVWANSYPPTRQQPTGSTSESFVIQLL